MFSETPTVPPAGAGGIGGFDQHAGDSLGAAVEDADLIVGQFQVFDFILEFAEILAQRDIERVHRAVSLGHRHDRLAVDHHFHHGFRYRLQVPIAVETALDHHPELSTAKKSGTDPSVRWASSSKLPSAPS